jgi:hypothetical protein
LKIKEFDEIVEKIPCVERLIDEGTAKHLLKRNPVSLPLARRTHTMNNFSEPKGPRAGGE